MEIRHLKLVRAVGNLGSLTKASEVLFVSQSALSHQLKELEDEFGVSFFNRSNKGLVLTEKGEIFFSYSIEILNKLEKLKNEIGNVNNKKRIRFTIQAYTSYYWLTEIIKTLKIEEDVDLEVITENTTNPLKLIKEGQVDIALMVYKTEDIRLCFEPVFSDELVLLVSNNNLISKKEWIESRDLEKQVLITHSNIFERNKILEKANNDFILAPKEIREVRNTLTIIEFVEENLGVAILSKWAIERYLDKAKVKTIKIGQSGTFRYWYIAYLKMKKLEFREKRLIELIQKQVR